MTSKRSNLTSTQSHFFEAMRGLDSELKNLIEPIGNLSAQDCVNIYARAYKARLMEVLGDTFESCWWVLGDNTFFQIAGNYIDKNPSQVYDLDLYGEGFPEHLGRSISDLKFLSELAKFEWLFKTIFHKKNIGNELIDWTGLLTEKTKAHLTLSDSARLYSASNNVYAIWKERKGEQKKLQEDLIDQPFQAIVYKFNSQVYVKELSPASFGLLKEIADSGNVLNSLEKLPQTFPDISANDIQIAFSTLSELPVFETQEPSHA